VYKKPYIKNRTEAQDFANFIITQFSQPLLSSVWAITDVAEIEDFNSWLPNQYIYVVDNIRGIMGDFIIKKIEYDTDGIMKVWIGENKRDIIEWQKEVQQRIKQLEENTNNINILTEDEVINESVEIQVSDTVEIKYRDLPTDYMYLGDNDKTPVYADIGAGTERPLSSIQDTDVELNNYLFENPVSGVVTDLSTNSNDATFTFNGVTPYDPLVTKTDVNGESITGYEFVGSSTTDECSYIEGDAEVFTSGTTEATIFTEILAEDTSNNKVVASRLFGDELFPRITTTADSKVRVEYAEDRTVYDGTIVGGPTILNGGLVLDGVTDGVIIKNNSVFTILPSSCTNFTVFADFNYTQFLSNNDNTIISLTNGVGLATTNTGMWLEVVSNANTFRIGMGSGSAREYEEYGTITSGQQYKVAMVFDKGTCYWYINGAYIKSTTWSLGTAVSFASTDYFSLYIGRVFIQKVYHLPKQSHLLQPEILTHYYTGRLWFQSI
jgi:hypothetical protein